MIIGLTGGIGTGKSTVAKVFALLGASIFNSDENAKQQYFIPNIKKQVIDLLGEQCYLDNSTINRKYISQKIFSDTSLLKKLNEIIHPAVVSDFKKFAELHSNGLVIKESALLFETGLYRGLDKVILVVSPLDLRINRVMQRDGLSEMEVKNKIKSQLSDDEKRKLADYIISNNEQDSIIEQCLEIYSKLVNV